MDLLALLEVSYRYDTELELVNLTSRTMTIVTLSKGPCHVWWAVYDDTDGGPVGLWMTNLAELLVYWRRFLERLDIKP